MRRVLAGVFIGAFACGPRVETPAVDVVPPAPAPVVTAAAEVPPPTLAGGRIAATADGALVIDADSGVLFAVDRGGQATGQLVIGRDAGLLAYDPARQVAFVADRRGDRLVVVDVERMAVLDAWETPAEPFGVAITPDGATVLVATIADRTLVAFDAASGAARWGAPLSPEPRGVAVSPDGTRALVSTIAAGALDDVALTEPHRVTAIPFELDCGMCEPGTVFARGTGGVQFLDAQRAVASFQRDVPEASFIHSSSGYGGGNFVPPVTHHLAFVALPEEGAPSVTVAQVPEHQPRTLAWDPTDDALYIAGLGSDTVLHLPGLSRGTTAGVEDRASDAMLRGRARCGPDGAAIARGGDVLLWCSFTRSVLRISGVAGGGRLADDAQLDEGPALVPSSWTPLQHDGLVLFQVSTPAINADNALACTTCHPDGRADGLTWHIGGRHHQTPILAGRLAGTHPYKWDGTDATLAASLHTTVSRLHGVGLAPPQVEALVAYLQALPPVRTPTRDAGAVARGRQVFEQDGGCAACHEGATYSDGDRHVFEGTTTGIDTPSLIGLAASAPYFHDGSATTLDDLLRGYGTVRGMADLDALTLEQRADLKAFLETR